MRWTILILAFVTLLSACKDQSSGTHPVVQLKIGDNHQHRETSFSEESIHYQQEGEFILYGDGHVHYFELTREQLAQLAAGKSVNFLIQDDHEHPVQIDYLPYHVQQHVFPDFINDSSEVPD